MSAAYPIHIDLDEMPRRSQWGYAYAQAPRVPWDVFVNNIKWLQGEHVALIGPTGQGKTTLLLNLIPFRQFVVVFATKPKDDTMTRLINEGSFTKMPRWLNKRSAIDTPRRVVWPNARQLGSVVTQRDAFKDAFEKIYLEGGWTVVVDELWYMVNTLKLDHEIKMFLLQARSLGISLLGATQRPAWVPLEVYSQSTHLFFWRDSDDKNLARVSELNAANKDIVKYLVSDLEPHQVLYVNSRTGQMMRTRTPAPRKELRK